MARPQDSLLVSHSSDSFDLPSLRMAIIFMSALPLAHVFGLIEPRGYCEDTTYSMASSFDMVKGTYVLSNGHVSVLRS